MEANPNTLQLATEGLDKNRWWIALDLIVDFLRSKHIDKVFIEFGFILDRDLAGKAQAEDQTVQLDDLVAVIKKGFEEGTIEWARCSDCRFYPVGLDFNFMLCNDADVHLASTDSALLVELGRKIYSIGIKVYGSKQIINFISVKSEC